jgi:23S rRNA pseudouridine1911/1915/1917 synthase
MRTPRSIVIDRKNASRSLLEVLQTGFRLPRQAALDALRQKKVRICGGVCVDPLRRVKAGQTIQLEVKPRADKPALPDGARQIVVCHVDAEIIVVEKPAGLTTVRHADEVAALGKRAKKFLPRTLVDLMPAVLAHRDGEPCRVKGRIRAVHRIDKETSGLMVLA